MAIHKIVTVGHPVLRQKAKKVRFFDRSLQKLVEEMFETLHAVSGAGLAAPQIALSMRLFVAQYENNKVAICNPEIVKAKGQELGREGCLSIPGYVGDNIPRAAEILVKGQDVHGRQVRLHAEGWFARILQHEIDHLNGVLYLDRLTRPEDLLKVVRRNINDENKESEDAL